jgi:hypothetical protein
LQCRLFTAGDGSGASGFPDSERNRSERTYRERKEAERIYREPKEAERADLPRAKGNRADFPRTEGSGASGLTENRRKRREESFPRAKDKSVVAVGVLWRRIAKECRFASNWIGEGTIGKGFQNESIASCVADREKIRGEDMWIDCAADSRFANSCMCVCVFWVRSICSCTERRRFFEPIPFFSIVKCV